MQEYSELLVLSYFKQLQDDYSLQALMRLLGLTLEPFQQLIESCMLSGYLEYKQNMLKLTMKGRIYLLDKTPDHMRYGDREIIPDTIDPSIALPLDMPYVPEKFTTKLR